MESKPEKLDLILSPTRDPMTGGNPAMIIERMEIGTNNNFLLESPAGPARFEFTNLNVPDRGGRFGGHKYLAKGGLTAVFEVKKVDDDNTPLILKVSTDAPLNEDYIQNEYMNQKKLFGKIIPDIYYYGTLSLPDGTTVIEGNDMKYTIMKKYGDEKVFLGMESDEKYEFFKKVIDIMVTFNKKGYVWRDMKTPNIGIDENNNPMIIDYDEHTVIQQDHYRGERCRGYCSGTYSPNYMINEYIRNVRRDSQDKMAAMGIIELILQLFYPDNLLNYFVTGVYADIYDHKSFDNHRGIASCHRIPSG